MSVFSVPNANGYPNIGDAIPERLLTFSEMPVECKFLQ
jgi:hypothetical protein